VSRLGRCLCLEFPEKDRARPEATAASRCGGHIGIQTRGIDHGTEIGCHRLGFDVAGPCRNRLRCLQRIGRAPVRGLIRPTGWPRFDNPSGIRSNIRFVRLLCLPGAVPVNLRTKEGHHSIPCGSAISSAVPFGLVFGPENEWVSVYRNMRNRRCPPGRPSHRVTQSIRNRREPLRPPPVRDSQSVDGILISRQAVSIKSAS
jgi:hypothetical protein